jgi:DNA-binding NarL/FixJ family response regulator
VTALRFEPPVPDVVIGVVGVGIELPKVPEIELRRLSVLALERLPRVDSLRPPASRRAPGRSASRSRLEDAFVIDSTECVREVGALLDRLVRRPLGPASPCLVVAGALPDALVDHALYARVQLYPRSLGAPDALDHALVVAAWLARDRMRRRPELGVAWAVERLAPWVAQGRTITERQAQVLALGTLGMSQREIALSLQIDRSTVEKHAAEVMERLGVASFEHAVQPLSERLAAALGDGPVPPARLPRELRKTARDDEPPRAAGQVGTIGPRFRRGS